jgi:hypothetical protein
MGGMVGRAITVFSAVNFLPAARRLPPPLPSAPATFDRNVLLKHTVDFEDGQGESAGG